jgi:hypothetical protein
MPFTSEKQRRWMHANQPAMAKRWEAESGSKTKKRRKKKLKSKKD